MDLISIRFLKGLDFLVDARIVIMENKNYAISSMYLFAKPNIPYTRDLCAVIYVTVLGRDNNGKYGDMMDS
jgi:hypothetical protein